MTYGSWSQILETHPGDRIAAIDATGSLTYHELLQKARALSAEIGQKRTLVALECDNTTDWLVAYVAVLLGQHVAILLPSGDAAQAQALSAGVLLRPETGYQPHRLDAQPPDLHEDLCLLLSTSGSTGSSKFVRLSHQNLQSNAASIATYLELDASERGVVNLPVHYSYGLSIINSHLWVGAAVLMTESSVIEPVFWDFCRTHGATSFAGVPHSYDLMSRIDLDDSLPASLRYFTQAGGRLPPERVLAFDKIARQRGLRFYVMYGQTEAAPRISWLPPEHTQAHAASIGIAVPGGTLSVRDQDGQVLPPETEGELTYEGLNVMMGYATCAADLAKAAGPSELRTGDLARMSEDGFFYITGRMSRFIKIFGNRIGLDDVEQLCAAASFDTVATGIDGKLLVVTRQTGQAAEIKALLVERLKLPGLAVDVREMAEYPVLSTGKIDYQQLRASIASATAPDSAAAPIARAQAPAEDHVPPATPEEEQLVQIWETTLGISPIGVTDSFLELGGDSMTAVHLMLEMERTGLSERTARAILQGATIRELARDQTAAATGEAGEQVVEKSTAPLPAGRLLSRMGLHGVRGILVCLLVIGHWFPGVAARVPPLQGLEDLLRPLFSLNTPGFAIIFGVSLGYFSYDAYQHRPVVFYRQIRLGLIMLSVAMVLMSAIGLLVRVLLGESITSNWFFSSFYNVIGFYLLALASTPLWFALLHRARSVWLGLGGLLAVFICLDIGMKWAFTETQTEDFLQLLRLYATAKFSYFNMSVGALLGIGVGLALHNRDDLPLRASFRIAGGILVGLGLVWCAAVDDLNALLAPSTEITYWRWCLYMGVTLCLTALVWPVMARYGQRRGVFAWGLKALMSIGVLALPFFIFHGLVLSLKALTDALGVPDLIGLVLVLGVFFGVSSLAVIRVWRLYFD